MFATYRQSITLFSVFRTLQRRTICSSHVRCNKQTHPMKQNPAKQKAEKDMLHELELEDFRPAWVYTGTKLLTYLVVPAIALYGVFIYDFGDQEHVFQPPRRWLLRQKESFFTLTPEEQKLIKSAENSPFSKPPP
ncbi:uncharacterized protein BT62DRAFT_561321 [Guyanagaster necrorhizus]|uniref:Uncharacterized protein n=1 Tax=Guyanagaster necrorhizus TaxID=856835 RepID=A0A9P7VHT7_9AGAR|nr:uncharacterized protein BT62DRAFT_561321 [Guyanagaster necrorhizus MCA 3950]KAG7440815.1 hypothetical protein BT62DRAFT_561321 [Guyanagaster necrorhizus MCA 3950]